MLNDRYVLEHARSVVIVVKVPMSAEEEHDDKLAVILAEDKEVLFD